MLKYIYKSFATFALSLIALSSSSLSGQEWFDANGEFWQPLSIRTAYQTGTGIGRNVGYSTIAAFYCPEAVCDTITPYLDVRLHYTNKKRWAGNFGVGAQKVLQTCDSTSLVRGYVYYDFRNSSYRKHEQVTVGAEWFGSCYDLHLNTYWPIFREGHAHRFGRVFRYHRGGFHAQREHNEFTWRGAELLISKQYPFFELFSLYASVGPYYFNSRHHSTFGVKGRVETVVYKDLALALQTSYDHHFGWRGYAELSWTMPLVNDCCCEPTCCVPVLREELIVLTKACQWHKNF